MGDDAAAGRQPGSRSTHTLYWNLKNVQCANYGALGWPGTPALARGATRNIPRPATANLSSRSSMPTRRRRLRKHCPYYGLPSSWLRDIYLFFAAACAQISPVQLGTSTRDVTGRAPTRHVPL